MDAFFDITKHTLTITGFVSVIMLVIEYVNVFTQGAWQTHLAGHRWGQYVLAALLGATPGCLGAFSVVGMYSHGVLTHGAMIAAMIATMGDETFVMLAIMPGQGLFVLSVLFVLGVVVGALADTLARPWISLRPAVCDALKIHQPATCHCFSARQIVRQWLACSTARGILSITLALLIAGLIFGLLGPLDWNWIRITLLVVSSGALFIVVTAPDHFLNEHLWNHVVRKHVPSVFLWVLGASLVIYIVIEQLHLEDALERGRWLVLLVACLLGLIPSSGPHLIFLTLFAQGALPFSIFLASSIVQDGHGMLPMLAHSRKAFLGIKLVNLIVGLMLGAVLMLAGW
ncbi:MAG: putative manganese transporter [Opitutales bacterium]